MIGASNSRPVGGHAPPDTFEAWTGHATASGVLSTRRYQLNTGTREDPNGERVVSRCGVWVVAVSRPDDIADNGGTPNTIARSGAALANADTERAIDGQLIYPGGFSNAVGLNPVVVPGLPHVLVYDSTRMFTVVNGGLSQVDISDSFRFDFDAVTLRIKARVACACPVPDKTIRRLTISTAAPAKKTAPAKS